MFNIHHYKNVFVRTGLIAAGFVLLVAVGQFGTFNPSYKNEWQLFKKPEQVVEFYFTPGIALPKKYSPGATATINVTATAYGSPAADYKYEVVQENAATRQQTVLKRGVFHLADSQPRIDAITVRYSDGGSHSRIIVRLPEQHQSLHFWMEKQ